MQLPDLNELSTITDSDLLLVRDTEGNTDYHATFETLKEYMKAGVLDYVTYAQFGADLTGTTPSDIQIKACHDFANANNLQVRQNWGMVYWQTTEIEVRTPTDLSGLTVRMDANSGTASLTYSQPTMFTLPASESPIVFSTVAVDDLNNNYSEYFKKLSHRLPNEVFGEYNGAMVKIQGTELDVNRGGNVANFFNKQESVTLSRRGQTEQPIYKGYVGTVESVTVYPRETSQFHFKCPNLHLDGVASFCFLRIERSNTKVTGLVITEGSTWPSSVREVVQALNCYKIVLEDWDCLAMALGNTSAGGIYCFTGAHIIGLHAERLRGNGGWGFTGCNYLKNVTFNNNDINRIDCHWGAYDITVNNNRLINFGCLLAGGGTFTARDNEYHITGPLDSPIGESIVRALFEARPDYGAEWDGDILIDGLTYIIDPAYIIDIGTNQFDVVRMVPSPSNVDFGRAMYHGRNVVIKNVFFRMDGTQQDDTSDLTLSLNALNYGNVAVGAQDQFYPHNIIVDNMSTTHQSDKVKLSAYIPPNYMASTTRALYDAVSVAEGDYNQKVSISNISSGQNNYTGGRALRGLVRFNLDWSLTSSTWTGYTTDTQAIRPLIEVHNCQGAELGIAVVGNVKVFNSEVRKLQTRTFSGSAPFGPSASQVFINCYDSVIKLTSSFTGADSWEPPEETWVYNCGFADLVTRGGGASATGSANKFKGKGNRKVAPTTAWTSTTPFLFDGEDAYITASGTPVAVVTPAFIGQLYKDSAAATTTGLYQATGLTTADWVQLG